MSLANATSAAAAGSATVQGELGSVRAPDYAEAQEPTFLPLYESVRGRPELANASVLLDVGCGPDLAVQTFAKAIRNVAGVDASRPSLRSPGGACQKQISASPRWKRYHTPTARLTS
jgi:2-polyprenyl-3-methyl-5-hydroxy-6-metoxy-1,4-benzoquinol methylase